jgi:integrase
MLLIKKAAVPKIRFHNLRHTYATLLLAKGVNVKVIAERLGHSNIKIALDTY